MSTAPLFPDNTPLRGVTAALSNMKKYRNLSSPTQQRRILRAQAQLILDRSQHYVPKEYGDLAVSGRIVVSPDTAEVFVVYGANTGRPGDTGPLNVRRPNSPGPFYAVIVHEFPLNHAPPTQWKYLSTAVSDVWTEMVGVGAEEGRSILREVSFGGTV